MVEITALENCFGGFGSQNYCITNSLPNSLPSPIASSIPATTNMQLSLFLNAPSFLFSPISTHIIRKGFLNNNNNIYLCSSHLNLGSPKFPDLGCDSAIHNGIMVGVDGNNDFGDGDKQNGVVVEDGTRTGEEDERGYTTLINLRVIDNNVGSENNGPNDNVLEPMDSRWIYGCWTSWNSTQEECFKAHLFG